MEKLIFRKFLKDVTQIFIMSSLTIALIVWVIQAVNFLDLVSEDGHSLRIYFLYTLYSLPKIFSRILPFIFFISLYLSIMKYEQNNELIIFWNNGIKKSSFFFIVIKYSLIYLLLQIIFTTAFVPYSQNKARSFIRSSSIDFFPSLIKEKKFIDTVHNLTLFINKKKENGELENIFLKEKMANGRSQIITAEKGILDNKFLILFDGQFLNQDLLQTDIISFKKTIFNLSKYQTKTTTIPKFQELNTFLLYDCLSFYFGGRKFLEKSVLKCNSNTVSKIAQEFFKRLYLPLYLPIISLIACMLILYSKDSFKYNFYRSLIFTIGVVILIVSEISVRYLGTSNLSSLMFLLLPFLISFLIFIFIYKQLKFKYSA